LAAVQLDATSIVRRKGAIIGKAVVLHIPSYGTATHLGGGILKISP
jgi:hypothetical protein